MPNWCEGTMKMRGNYEDLKKFAAQGIKKTELEFEDVGGGNMKPILTREEVAERWQCTLPTVDARVKSGVLKPCRKLPPGRFRYEDVLAAEGVEFDPMQPSERLRLEKENEALRNENKMLNDMLNSIAGKIMPYMMKKQVKVGE